MTPERWQQIEKLCYEALELDSERRSAFLNRLSASDEDLGREVESMIAAHDRAGDFLQQNALEIEAEALALEKTRPLPVQNFSHYRVISRIGAGGMGEVWLAHDNNLDRNVALKFLPTQFTHDKDRLLRFVREAKAASALNHPNIITIHEIGEAETAEGKTHFIATEFIEGQTLRQVLANEELSLKKALDIAIQAAAALDAAHHVGIVHRDIKPENIMLRPDGLVKVLDFGLAKLDIRRSLPEDSVDTSAKTQPEVVKTQPGMILGTLRYMSPEQARGRELDARTDIFSLGVVLYELIAKQPLFAGETSADVIAAIINKEPYPLSDYDQDTPPELERIVGKSLAKDCRDRYQTARDLQIDLQNLKQESELSARLNRSGQKSLSDRRTSVSGKLVTQMSGELAAQRFTIKQLLLALPIVALSIGAIWWFAFGRSGQVKAPLLSSLKKVEVFTWPSAPGEIYAPGAFSTDGMWVAFTSTQSGRKNIWIKQAASGDAEPSTKDESGNDNPIWSPNGEEIAFFSLKGNQAGIWRKPPFGGTATLLKALPNDEGKGFSLRYWSKSGKTIYYESNGSLFALDVGSGKAKPLTDFAAAKISVNADTISISRDEQRIAYVTHNQDDSVSLWVRSVRGGVPEQIAMHSADVKNTVWHPDGKRILYSAKVEGTYQIFVADVDGRQPSRITAGDKDSFVLDVSAPDGARILYSSSKEESDVWGVNVNKAEEFTMASDISAEFWPDVARDNLTIAYQAVRNLSQGNKIFHCSLLIKSPDTEARPIAQDAFLPKWSPDGNRLAFLRVTDNDYSLWTVNATGLGERNLAKNGVRSISYSGLPYNKTQTSFFTWSNDSSKIIYSSGRNGQQNIWAVAADGSGEAPVTNLDDPNLQVNCPLLSADGKRVAWTSKLRKAVDGKKTYGVWITDLEHKESRVIFEADTVLRLLGWPLTEQELILATLKDRTFSAQPTEVTLIRISTRSGKAGEPGTIAVLQQADFLNLGLSPDKRTVAYASYQDGKNNIWAIPVNGGIPRKLTANNDPRLYFSSLAWSPDSRTIYFGKQSRFNQLSMLTNFE